jgi:hypothetical protein
MKMNSPLLTPSFLITLTAAALLFALDLILPLGWVVWLPYIGLVLLPLWLPHRESPLILAGLCTCFILLGLLFDYLYLPSGALLAMGIFNRALGIAVLWGIAALVLRQQRIEDERENLIHQLQDALANVKTLRGLLPFCPSCKKICEVNGYWSRIEAYVAKHSMAEFTPGLCPECEQYLSTQLPQEESVANGQR